MQASSLPTPAQQAWMALGYGMFIHFGPNTFTSSGWGDGRFPAEQFAPTALDTRQWAAIAAEAGMQYAVLTAKHHDGFCLWPTRHSMYCVANAPGRRDVVGEFVEAFRAAGLRVGLYYSLWDRNYPQYDDDAAYAEYMQLQVSELLTQYGEIVELWFDGGWDKDHPSREWPYNPAWETDPQSGLGHGERWRWSALYDSIHAHQPDCLVIQNASSDRPGQVKYHPVDARTSEHFHFIYQEEECHPVSDNLFTNHRGEAVYMPLEFCTSLNPNWFWIGGTCYSHPSVATICDWYQTARAYGGNFLLNVGPDRTGRLPEYHRPYLRQAADRLALPSG